MLYLILPPIVVIASIVALVYFFSRRFPEIEKDMPEYSEERLSNEGRGSIGSGVGKRIALGILERFAQWSKVMALRAHNALHGWAQSLREKKSASVVRPTPEERVESRNQSASPRQDIMPVSRRIRPMVSQRVAKPEVPVMAPLEPEAAPSPAAKNQLEDILVERIAANPRDLEAYERLGEYYMEQGNVQDAKECYRQVLRLSPVHRLAKIKIRRLEKMLEQK